MTTALALLCRFEKTQSVQSSLTPSSHTKKLPSDTEHDFQITSESKHRKIQIGWLPHWSSKINKVPHGIQPNMQNKFYNPNQEGWISFAKPTFLSPVTLESLEATSSPAKKKQEKPTLFAVCFFFQLSCFTQWNPLVVWRTLSLDPEQRWATPRERYRKVAVYTSSDFYFATAIY